MSLTLIFATLIADPAIIDKPIRFDAERERLTVAYRRAHQDENAKSSKIEPKIVVVHHTAFSTFKRTWAYFNEVRLRGRRRLADAGAVNVSSQFVVDRDGTIYRLMPETTMARHVIGLNHLAIGIENVGGTKKFPLTQAQLRANAELIGYLAKRFGITHVIGHHEYRSFEGHPYFVEKAPNYRTTKVDPGAKFMRRLRAKIRHLRLKGAPR